MKRKLLLAALCVVGALGMRAQTDVTSTYITNADFSAITGWTKINNKFSSTATTDNVTEWYLGNSNDYNSAYAALTQQLTNLEEGVYRFTIHGFFRTDNVYTNLVFFAETTDKTTYAPLKTLSSGTSAYGSTPSTRSTASTAFTTSEYWMSTMDNIIIDKSSNTGGNLLIGMKPSGQLSPSKPSNQWICVGNAKLYKLEGAALDGLRDEVVTSATNLYNEDTNATGASALNTAITTLSNKADDDLSYSDIKALMTAITTFRTARLADATTTSPQDVSYLIKNPGFEDGAKCLMNSEVGMTGDNIAISAGGNYEAPHGWTVNIANAGNSWDNSNIACSSDRSNATGEQTTASEGTYFYAGRRRWSQGTNEISQVISDLPNGTYKISVDLGKATSSAVAGTFTATLNGTDVLSATPTNKDLTTFTSNSFVVDNENNDLTIKFASATSGNADRRFIVDNVVLTFYGDPLLAAQAEWQEVHDALDVLDETALPDAAENAITTELGKTEPTTVEGYNAAKADLQALIDSYDEIKAAYDKVNTLINFVTNEKDNSTGDKTDIEEAISTATTDIETRTAATDLEGDYNTLETARQTYVTSGAEPTAGHPFDWTFKLSNPSFESGTTSWTLDRNTTGQWNYGRSQNNPVDGAYNLDAWAPQINYIKVYQTVTLPLGSYSLKGYLYSSDLKSQHIYAYTTSDNPSSNLPTASSWEQLTADFTQSSKSGADVQLGIYSQGENISGNSKGWFRADHFQLFYNGIKPVLNDLIVSTTDLSAINVGTGAFQIPSSAVETLTTAIGDAQAVYNDDDATGSNIQTAIDNLNAAIETYQAVELNAPASGVQYRIKSTAADGASWKNKYYVLKKNPNQPNGGYSTQAEVETTDAFYATAWEFVSVNGNQYKLRMTDADGAVRYLCTNIKGYNDGSATQIRTTTEADKALVVKVIAATGTDGRWFLQNTEDNSYLGGQDAGLFSNSQNYDLAIEAASQAEVGVSVAAGKYATRIFPFTPTLPTGVKAYSCAAVDGETLTLVAVEEPAANVPYILYFENEVANTDLTLTGWGTAAATSYPVGLLTGVYTNAPVPAGKYVLQTQDGVQGFYQVAEGDNFEAIPYRAYLTWSGTHANVRALFFPADGEATGIEAIGVLTSGNYDAIYTAGGAKVNSLQKGLNIVVKDGKSYKIFVK